jgi:hypothetical protein
VSLSVAGARADCAVPAFSAILEVDTVAADPAAGGRRWTAIKGLQGALLLQGRSSDALAAVEGFVERWKFGSTLILLAAPYDSTHDVRARAIAIADQETFGPEYERAGSTRRWESGLLAVHTGQLELATSLVASLRRSADSLRATDPLNATRDSLMSVSVGIHVALARGDTARALSALRRLIPPAVPGADLSWDEAWPMAAERLMYAQLLLASGDARRAIDVATVFDSPAPMMHVLYLPASLRIRLVAAEKLGDRVLASRLRERIRLLKRPPS